MLITVGLIICKLVFIIMSVLSWLQIDRVQKFFQRHRILSGVLMIMCCIALIDLLWRI